MVITKVLHVCNWYPNPWDDIEGNFVRDQIRLFKKEQNAEVLVVQVRHTSAIFPTLYSVSLDDGARGYFLSARMKPGKVLEWSTTLLLFFVLLKERAWRFDAFHFHIAYPLLIHSKLWRWLFRRPIVISEHWSAYHYNFYLPDHSKALRSLRKPFQQGDPVFVVSEALLNDIRDFSGTDRFPAFIIPNVVPLRGASEGKQLIPTVFVVNRWASIKNPMPMLEGLELVACSGFDFKLIIGGYGELVEKMQCFVNCGALKDRTTFLGKMTKSEISEQLANCDGYLFSSDYETFSISCAEALGAGVPLIGPNIPAISEYSNHEDWVTVKSRDAAGWHAAIVSFLMRHKADEFDSNAIAQRAAGRFREEAIRQKYRDAMKILGLGVDQ